MEDIEVEKEVEEEVEEEQIDDNGNKVIVKSIKMVMKKVIE
jgi:hypothetical protein